MTQANWQIDSHKRLGLTYEDIKRAESSGIVCDAYKDKLFILNMCIPDFCKIKQFANACRLRKKKDDFLCYCYPYQEQLAQNLLGDFCNIKTVPQPKYEREVKANKNGF